MSEPTRKIAETMTFKPALGDRDIRDFRELETGAPAAEGFVEGKVEAADRYDQWQQLAENSGSGAERSGVMRLLGAADFKGEAFFAATPTDGGQAVTVFCEPPGFAHVPAPTQFFATYAGARGEVAVNAQGEKVIDLAFWIRDFNVPGGGREKVLTMTLEAARAGGFLDSGLKPLSPENVRRQTILLDGIEPYPFVRQGHMADVLDANGTERQVYINLLHSGDTMALNGGWGHYVGGAILGDGSVLMYLEVGYPMGDGQPGTVGFRMPRQSAEKLGFLRDGRFIPESEVPSEIILKVNG